MTAAVEIEAFRIALPPRTRRVEDMIPLTASVRRVSLSLSICAGELFEYSNKIEVEPNSRIPDKYA